MADGRYGGRSYGRSDSIFSDEDGGRERGSYDRHRSGSGDDRGFFQRAGEEVRSWFSDDNDERGGSRMGGESSRSNYGDYESRGGRSRQGQSGYGQRGYGSDYQGYAGSHGRNHGGSGGSVQSWGQANDAQGEQSLRSQSHGGRSESWGGGSDWGSSSQTSRGGSSARGNSSPFDDHYRSWRDQQISQMDREYDEYCRHRQQQFETDFHSWRQNRQGRNEQADGATPDQTGVTSGRTGTGGQKAGSGTTTRMSDDSDKSGPGGSATASSGSTTAGQTGAGSNAASGSGTRTGSRKSQDTK